ncbi:Uncharacterised protein [Vibrio cholerae]|nr:Uncharacterised protein [Vibrio cholerae]
MYAAFLALPSPVMAARSAIWGGRRESNWLCSMSLLHFDTQQKRWRIIALFPLEFKGYLSCSRKMFRYPSYLELQCRFLGLFTSTLAFGGHLELHSSRSDFCAVVQNISLILR